jgi:hypothetical protein
MNMLPAKGQQIPKGLSTESKKKMTAYLSLSMKDEQNKLNILLD